MLYPLAQGTAAQLKQEVAELLETLMQLHAAHDHIGSADQEGGNATRPPSTEEAAPTGIAMAAAAQLPLLLAAYGATLGGADRALLRVLLAVDRLVSPEAHVPLRKWAASQKLQPESDDESDSDDEDDGDDDADEGAEAGHRLQGRLASWGYEPTPCQSITPQPIAFSQPVTSFLPDSFWNL